MVAYYCYRCPQCERRWEAPTTDDEHCEDCKLSAVRDYRAEGVSVALSNLRGQS